MNLKKDIHGVTLVETMVAIAILAIASLVLVSGFLASSSLLRHGSDIKNTGQKVSAVVDGAEVDLFPDVVKQEPQSGRLYFMLNGSPIEITGNYTSAYETENSEIKFNIFVPDSYTP
ncbi:MAG: PulJ/GspJ family protein [Bacillota bacterium]